MTEDMENSALPYAGDIIQWKEIADKIVQIDLPQHSTPIKSPPRVQLISRSRYWAAASILLLFSVSILLLLFRKHFVTTPEKQVTAIKRDIPSPTLTQAILTLANGRKILLDSVADGSLAVQGKTRVSKLANGQLVYSGNDADQAMQFNILDVPQGSRIASITLGDGTKVWLNSGSMLKYPVAFSGTDRRVEISGEAYFEVAKLSGKKFFVSGGGITTEVLGTHFNVNVYGDETNGRVTLLEGSVKVHRGNEMKVLKPGEQAAWNKTSGNLKVLEDAAMDEAVAWKNGYFQFNRLDLQSIMRQIGRWYNVDVGYEGKSTEKSFSGIVSRSSNLSQVLKIMEQANIRFKIEGTKIIVEQ